MLNFVQRFDLVCSDSGPKTMITAAVVATIIGLIFIPSYSDNYGRKNPFQGEGLWGISSSAYPFRWLLSLY